MILAYLILGHLLGDFVFQPSSLVHWKMSSKKGVFVHILIHFLISILILLPLILEGYISFMFVAFFISGVHFFVDQAKISYDLKHDKKVKAFVIDQMLHLLAILLVYFFVLSRIEISLPETYFYLIYGDIRLISFIEVLVFVTSVIEIFRFQREREKNRDAKLKMHTREMLKRVFVFTLIYLLFIVLAVYGYGVK